MSCPPAEVKASMAKTLYVIVDEEDADKDADATLTLAIDIDNESWTEAWDMCYLNVISHYEYVQNTDMCHREYVQKSKLADCGL